MVKRLFAVCLAAVCVIGFSACGGELRYNAEYTYSGYEFSKAKDLKIEDLNAFLPAFSAEEIDSVKDFENFLRENFETYSIVRLTENGSEKVYLKTDITSVKADETTFTVRKGDTENAYAYTRDGDAFLTDLTDDFYFSQGEFHYELRFNEKFAVVYNYKAE